MCACVYMSYICESTWGTQKKASDTTELELQAAMSLQMWMLEWNSDRLKEQ